MNNLKFRKTGRVCRRTARNTKPGIPDNTSQGGDLRQFTNEVVRTFLYS